MDALEAIAEAIALHVGWLEEARQKGDRGGVYKRWALRLEALQSAAEELRRLRGLHGADRRGAEDMSDLPPALLAQLSGPRTDPLEAQILAVLRAAGGPVELDRLLIELYRRHGDVHARKALNNKAYRMVNKRLIVQAPDRRGVYSLAPD